MTTQILNDPTITELHQQLVNANDPSIRTKLIDRFTQALMHKSYEAGHTTGYHDGFHEGATLMS